MTARGETSGFVLNALLLLLGSHFSSSVIARLPFSPDMFSSADLSLISQSSLMNDNDNENSQKRTSDQMDADNQLDSESNNHHNLEIKSEDLLSHDSVDPTLPPTKKIRTNEELDIRFLVSSKVSYLVVALANTVILIRFSSKEAGAIIGKGGANINNLRKNVRFLSN